VNKRKSVNLIKKGFASLLALVILAVTGACARDPQPPTLTNDPSGAAFPVSIIDGLGRTVTITKEPQRIISLAPSNTEVVYALGLEDKLVGVTGWCDYPLEVASKERVGDIDSPDLEKIVSLSPDLILGDDLNKALIPALERLGITCYVPVPHNLDETMQSILDMGRITGAGEKANEIVADMQARLKKITDKTGSLPDSRRPSVMYVVWYPPLFSVSRSTPIHEMITLVGGVNIVKDATGWPTLSLEEVISGSPEIIIVNVEEYPGGDAPLQELLAEGRLRTVRAIAEGRVYGIGASYTNRTGPRIIEGLEWLAALIHPELFPELAQEYGARLN